jgi:hypothetical protein
MTYDIPALIPIKSLAVGATHQPFHHIGKIPDDSSKSKRNTTPDKKKKYRGATRSWRRLRDSLLVGLVDYRS